MPYCPFTDEKCINEITTCFGCSFNSLDDSDDIEESEEENYIDSDDENFDIDYMIMFTNNEDYLPLTEDELPY